MQSEITCARCAKSTPFLLANGLCTDCALASSAHASDTSSMPRGAVAATQPSSQPVVNTMGTSGLHQAIPNAPSGYELLNRLGGGGMGDVYLVREQASDRRVAMKLLRYSTSSDDFERFLTELRVLAKIEHPNIVRVYASDFLRSVPYFTMEYMESKSLSDTIRGKTLQPSEAVRIVRAVCDAVAAAHAANVIHRDLKPSNILIAADGTPKVADFGLAKQMDQEVSLTGTNGALGTPSYMPPEQITRKNGDIGPWSDVYGLGATLYHMLAGHAPFLGDSSEAVVAQVLLEAPARLRTLRADIPLALEGIVLKCMEKDPKDRYQTAAELSADLDRFTAGEKPVAPPLTRFRRAKRWARANRRRVVTFAAVLVLLVGATLLGAAARPKAVVPVKRDEPAEIRKELAAGREVVLIGDDGVPRWHKWQRGGTVFAKSALDDNKCTFETIGSALLELLDDPGIDHYRIRVQLRHTGWHKSTSAIGVYFGYSEVEGPVMPGVNNSTVVSMMAVTYMDHDPFFPTTGKWEPQGVHLARRIRVETPNRMPQSTSHSFAGTKFIPNLPLPQKWRTIQIDVTPTEMGVSWENEQKAHVLFTNQYVPDAHDPVVAFSKLQDELNKFMPGNRVTIPKWSPRMPFGIYCTGATMSIRSAVISPLPKPQS